MPKPKRGSSERSSKRKTDADKKKSVTNTAVVPSQRESANEKKLDQFKLRAVYSDARKTLSEQRSMERASGSQGTQIRKFADTVKTIVKSVHDVSQTQRMTQVWKLEAELGKLASLDVNAMSDDSWANVASGLYRCLDALFDSMGPTGDANCKKSVYRDLEQIILNVRTAENVLGNLRDGAKKLESGVAVLRAQLERDEQLLIDFLARIHDDVEAMKAALRHYLGEDAERPINAIMNIVGDGPLDHLRSNYTGVKETKSWQYFAGKNAGSRTTQEKREAGEEEDSSFDADSFLASIDIGLHGSGQRNADKLTEVGVDAPGEGSTPASKETTSLPSVHGSAHTDELIQVGTDTRGEGRTPTSKETTSLPSLHGTQAQNVANDPDRGSLQGCAEVDIGSNQGCAEVDIGSNQGSKETISSPAVHGGSADADASSSQGSKEAANLPSPRAGSADADMKSSQGSKGGGGAGADMRSSQGLNETRDLPSEYGSTQKSTAEDAEQGLLQGNDAEQGSLSLSFQSSTQVDVDSHVSSPFVRRCERCGSQGSSQGGIKEDNMTCCESEARQQSAQDDADQGCSQDSTTAGCTACGIESPKKTISSDAAEDADKGSSQADVEAAAVSEPSNDQGTEDFVSSWMKKKMKIANQRTRPLSPSGDARQEEQETMNDWIRRKLSLKELADAEGLPDWAEGISSPKGSDEPKAADDEAKAADGEERSELQNDIYSLVVAKRMASVSTTGNVNVAKYATSIQVASIEGFKNGDEVVIGKGTDVEETSKILKIACEDTRIILSKALQFDHAKGFTIEADGEKRSELQNDAKVVASVAHNVKQRGNGGRIAGWRSKLALNLFNSHEQTAHYVSAKKIHHVPPSPRTRVSSAIPSVRSATGEAHQLAHEQEKNSEGNITLPPVHASAKHSVMDDQTQGSSKGTCNAAVVAQSMKVLRSEEAAHEAARPSSPSRLSAFFEYANSVETAKPVSRFRRPCGAFELPKLHSPARDGVKIRKILQLEAMAKSHHTPIKLRPLPVELSRSARGLPW